MGEEMTSLPGIPEFSRPVAWNIARPKIAGILTALGTEFPELSELIQEAHKKARKAGEPAITVFMMPDEAKMIWLHFAKLRVEQGETDATSK